MPPARSLLEYRAELQGLLDDAARALTDSEAGSLRALVQQERHGRRGKPGLLASARVRRRATEIVRLLGHAASELRPRETQELDDLVAGRVPREPVPAIVPIRLHRARSVAR